MSGLYGWAGPGHSTEGNHTTWGLLCLASFTERSTAVLPGLAGVHGSVHSTAEPYFPVRTDAFCLAAHQLTFLFQHLHTQPRFCFSEDCSLGCRWVGGGGPGGHRPPPPALQPASVLLSVCGQVPVPSEPVSCFVSDKLETCLHGPVCHGEEGPRWEAGECFSEFEP